MTFKDIEYQDTAVNELLDLLDDAWANYRTSVNKVASGQRTKPQRFAVYLSALTGAGKTIMVGRVLERLLHEPDAVILWLSDSPSLNQQTRSKLEEIIESNRLRIVDKVGVNDRMEPGYVYFLNPQKLGKQKEGGKGEQEAWARWRLIAEAMTDRTVRLYVVQDEAHRGVSKTASPGDDKIITSIVEATSEHLSGVEPVPVILGLSATPKKFEEAMKSSGRTLNGHVVDPKAIQESGLVKRDLDFRTPDEPGTKDKGNREAQLGMLDEAVGALKESDDAWAAFHTQESSKPGYAEQRVVPLLLFQVPDGISDEQLGEWVRHLNDAWHRHFGHGLPPGAVAHVLQVHKAITASDFVLPYCAPQQVQDRTEIRVLIAKLAVSTGWDCPRAEVLYSLRGHNDETYIAQLVGRMVRMPLAERALSVELDVLNVSRVLLPYFEQHTLARVVTGVKEGSIPSEPKVAMVRVDENASVVEAHGTAPFDLVSALTKRPAPTNSSNPVALLNTLAVMVAMDRIAGVGDDPEKTSTAELLALLDAHVEAHPDEVKAAITDLGFRSESQSVAKNWASDGALTHTTSRVALDAAGRKAKVDRLILSLPGGLGSRYTKHLRARGMDPAGARDRVAAVAQSEDALSAILEAARAKCREWLQLVRVALEADAAKPSGEQTILEARQIEYRKRMLQFGDPVPSRIGVLGPREVSFGPVKQRFPHGWAKHLFVEREGDGLYRLDVSSTSWEKQVLDRETARDSVVAWYRNPSSGAEFTLQIAWKDTDGFWRSAHPDFVFVERIGEELKPSVVDPHDPDRDGLLRLRGLAKHVEVFGTEYARFWSVGNSASGAASLRYLDLLDESVRAAILAESADGHALYRDHGKAYAATTV